jgi:hypothetical protein
MSKNYKLRHGNKTIPVVYATAEEMRVLYPDQLEKNESYCGLYSGMNQKIYLNSILSDSFPTLIHELGEYIISEYGVEISHEQLSVITKVFADILQENKATFKKLL